MPGWTWHKIFIGGSPIPLAAGQAISWQGTGKAVGGAVSPTVGTGGWHQAWRAPSALLLHGLQMLGPGGRLRVPSGKSRRVLQISASSLAGGSATWKTTGISLVWSGLDPVSPPGMSCTCTGMRRRGWVLWALPGGIWGVLLGQDHPTSADIPGLGEEQDVPAWTPHAVVPICATGSHPSVSGSSSQLEHQGPTTPVCF